MRKCLLPTTDEGLSHRAVAGASQEVDDQTIVSPTLECMQLFIEVCANDLYSHLCNWMFISVIYIYIPNNKANWVSSRPSWHFSEKSLYFREFNPQSYFKLNRIIFFLFTQKSLCFLEINPQFRFKSLPNRYFTFSKTLLMFQVIHPWIIFKSNKCFLNHSYLLNCNSDLNMLYMKFDQKNVQNLNMILFLAVKYF